MTKSIPLTQGKFAIVDDDDYEKIKELKERWSYHHTGYAVRSFRNKRQIRMHNLIISCPSGKTVDHKNGNGLDNRRENLRICDHSQNGGNRKKSSNNTTGYKGVRTDGKNKDRFRAQIRFNGALLNLGTFDNAALAAKKYDEKARELFGEFARCNFE